MGARAWEDDDAPRPAQSVLSVVLRLHGGESYGAESKGTESRVRRPSAGHAAANPRLGRVILLGRDRGAGSDDDDATTPRPGLVRCGLARRQPATRQRHSSSTCTPVSNVDSPVSNGEEEDDDDDDDDDANPRLGPVRQAATRQPYSTRTPVANDVDSSVDRTASE